MTVMGFMVSWIWNRELTLWINLEKVRIEQF